MQAFEKQKKQKQTKKKTYTNIFLHTICSRKSCPTFRVVGLNPTSSNGCSGFAKPGGVR